MECKHCSNEIPNGSIICPECGGRQISYIGVEAREKEPASKRKRSRASIMNLITIIFVIVVAVGGIILIGQNSPRPLGKVEEIESKFNKINEMRANNEPENKIGDEIEILSTMVKGFLKNNPEDSEEVRHVKSLYIEAIQAPVSAADGDVGSEAVDNLIREEGRSSILRVLGAFPVYSKADRAYGLEIEWSNMSDLAIKEIVFTVQAFDADGNPAECEEKMTSIMKANVTSGEKYSGDGAEYRNVWYNAWKNPDVSYLEITNIGITYDNGTALTIKRDLVEYVLSDQ